MKLIVVPLALCLALAVAACGEKNTTAPAAAPTQPAAAPTEPAAAPTEPAAAPTEPAAAPAAAFSKEEADKQLAALEGCTSKHGCEGYDALVALGPEIGAQAYAYAMDDTKPAKARGVAMAAIGATAAKVDVAAMYTAIRESKERDLLSGFEALLDGVEPDDAGLAEQLRADVLVRDRSVDAMAARRMLRHVAGTLDWAFTQLEGTPEQRDQVTYADLIGDIATNEHAARTAALIDKATHPMARHRLAATAISLGDHGHYGVLFAGLRSEDTHDRSDAANMLARVIKQMPDALQGEARELLESGKARDAGGLTSRGYDSCLKVLGEG